jgi:hypothetical protein
MTEDSWHLKLIKSKFVNSDIIKEKRNIFWRGVL